MAFCIKCGKQIDDGNTLCEECMQVDNDVKKKIDITNNLEVKKLLNKKILVPVIALVLIVSLVVVLTCTKKPYEKELASMVKTLNDRSTDFKDLTPLLFNGFEKDLLKEKYKLTFDEAFEDDDYSQEDYEADLADEFDEMYDEFDDEYGDDWECTYEIKRVEKMDDDELDDMQDEWDDFVDNLHDGARYYEEKADDSDEEKDVELYEEYSKLYEKYAEKYDGLKVKKGYKVKAKWKISGDDERDSETLEYKVVKIGNEWYGVGVDFDIDF